MVEAKDYQGWISGEPEDEYWVQTLCGSQLTSYKNYFYNPLMKNSSCIRSLQKELPDMKLSLIHIYSGKENISAYHG